MYYRDDIRDNGVVEGVEKHARHDSQDNQEPLHKEINVWQSKAACVRDNAHLDAGYLPFKNGFLVVLAFCVGLLCQVMAYARLDVVVSNRIGRDGSFGTRETAY